MERSQLSFDELIQQIVNAASLGAIYALFALGLAVVYSVFGLLNFAYGELITVGGYTMLALSNQGLPFWEMGVAAVIVAAIVSVVMELIVFRPLRGANAIERLFASFAVAVVIQNLVRQLISPRPQGVPVPRWFNEAIQIGSIRIGVLPLASLLVGTVCLGVLTLFLLRTRAGLAMRAAAADFGTARLMGVRANAVVTLAFAVSGVLAGVAAVLWVSRRTSVSPTMGFTPILKAFIATVIGGLGSLSGAVFGGFVLAALEIGMQVALPTTLLPFTDAVVLIVVVVVLYFRPHGLVGGPLELA